MGNCTSQRGLTILLLHLSVLVMKRITYIVLPLLLILSSCMNSSNSNIILWTDKPEIAAYVEEFNSTQEKFRLEIVYKKNPGEALSLSDNPPDFVISDFLSSPGIIDFFTPLDELLKEERLNQNIFYSEFLKMGRKGGNLLLLPVSFNLPAIMFNSESDSEDIPPFFLNPPEMEAEAKSFNEKGSSGFQVMGFSPRWESEVLYLNSVLMKAGFQSLSTGVLSWNSENILKSLEVLKRWGTEINNSFEYQEEFTTKFLYDPGYKLIAEKRILFYYSDLVGFFSIPPEKRKILDFTWFASENKIPVLEDAVLSGIPAGAKNRDGAVEFIYWLFSPETQKKLLISTQIKRLDTFGFANGFSSLPEVNENELPILYPQLAGSVPPEASLIFPDSLPLYWREIKKDVILPWFYNQTGKNSQKISLQEAIEEWLKQRPQ